MTIPVRHRIRIIITHTAPGTSSSASTRILPKNGHVLEISEDGGVFCQKCGKYTKFLKHQRLKILSERLVKIPSCRLSNGYKNQVPCVTTLD